MKSTKYILLICISIFLLSNISLGAEEQLSGKLLVQPEINENVVTDLNWTSMRFCNEWLEPNNLTPKSLITAQAGQIKKFCVMFFNNLEKDMNFYVWFSEAKKNDYNEWYCDEDMTNNNYSKLIREDFSTMKILVKPHTQAYQKFTLAIPETATWSIYGCLSYTIDGWYTHNTGEIFGLMIRKTAYMETNLTGWVYKYWRRDDMKDWYETNKSVILKILLGIIAVWLVVTIINTGKKKTSHSKSKNKDKK